jgi:phytoene synthase
MTFSFSAGSLAAPSKYMARHSRSFRFAAAFMNARDRARLTRVYAWCRFTDDMVDNSRGDNSIAAAQLDEWLELSRAAYYGCASGIDLVDSVMSEAADAGVPFTYASELAAGVRSDLLFRGIHDIADLGRYTYRVAGVVGRWLTQLFGVHDAWVLERAERLGHAMQLTNILRDVGEDWDRGRLYIPLSMLHAHRFVPNDIGMLRFGVRSVDARYSALMEELIAMAEGEYKAAWEAIPVLPASFRRSVAVAAEVYRGIHAEVRKNGYDNLTRRAATSRRRKLRLATAAMVSLGRAWRPPNERVRAVTTPAMAFSSAASDKA